MSEPKHQPPLDGPRGGTGDAPPDARSFVTGQPLAALAGLGAWRWLTTAAQEDGLPWPLRRVLRFNQGLAESLSSPQPAGADLPQ